MKIETFINNEAKKYKNKAIKNKRSGINLDKLEKMARQHTQNCYEFISGYVGYNYSEECKYKKMAEQKIQEVDDELFGCFNDKGKCLGYNYYR